MATEITEILKSRPLPHTPVCIACIIHPSPIKKRKRKKRKMPSTKDTICHSTKLRNKSR